MAEPVKTAAPANVQELQRQLQFNEKLKFVANKIHSADNINDILIKLKDSILSLFDAERITIYLVDPAKKELISKYLVGTGIKEIRVPISAASIAGYSAYAARMINITDVYDTAGLKQIDPNLHFDSTWDKQSGFITKQVLAAPILFENKLLGVIQLINKKTGGQFGKMDERSVIEIARVLGIAFRNQSKMIRTRFDHLVMQNIVTENELKAAVAAAREQKKDVETILSEIYKVKKSDIGISLAQFYGCRFIEFDNKIIIQKDILKGLNVAYLKKSFWFPMAFADNKAVIVIDNPKDPKTLEIKSLIKAKDYEFVVALREDIVKFLSVADSDSGKDQGSVANILAEMNVKEEKSEVEISDSSIDENAGAIVRLVNQVLIDGYEKGASDIHIEPSKAKKITYVRFRIDGTCVKNLEIPYSYSQALISRIKIMSNLDISERRLPQDGKIKFIYKETPVELRVATVPTVGGEDVVMRILASSKPMKLDDLHLSERDIAKLKELISYPYGIVLVVGPTGSGKTTTLHSALGYINTPERKIWTAEDPVEITQEGLRQVEVKPKIDFNFARAMRAFLRADPDVIMVGEMRDHETASIGIEASLTGHLVFSTLHTNSAPETVVRLIDMGIDPFNFADALLGVLAQRLVRTLCKKCKEQYHPVKEEFDVLASAYGKEFADLNVSYSDKFTLFRPKGCAECNQTGYKGRMGIYELLAGTKEVKTIIQRRGGAEEIRTQAIKDGMRTLFQDGIRKVFAGFTDHKQVRSVCINQ